ncbi:unnamed protein product [Ixodes pacificus]
MPPIRFVLRTLKIRRPCTPRREMRWLRPRGTLGERICRHLAESRVFFSAIMRIAGPFLPALHKRAAKYYRAAYGATYIAIRTIKEGRGPLQP